MAMEGIGGFFAPEPPVGGVVGYAENANPPYELWKTPPSHRVAPARERPFSGAPGKPSGAGGPASQTNHSPDQ